MKKSDFQQFNGKDGKPAYIAYKGHIYNVSESKHWKNGTHMNSHMAGEDLTDAFYIAPLDPTLKGGGSALQQCFAAGEQTGHHVIIVGNRGRLQKTKH